MAQSLTYEILKNELESYEKKIITFSKLISSDIAKMQKEKSYRSELSAQEADTLMNMVYKIMGEIEPDLAQNLLEIWDLLKNSN